MKSRLPLLLIAVYIFIVFSCKKENNPPVILDQIFSVKENSTPGLVCATISASDPDNDPLTYALDEENADFPFEIDANNGNIKIKSTANLDYEQTQQYKFKVKVKDDSQSSSALVTIQIVDLVETPNVIDQSFDVNENIVGIYSLGSVKFESKGQNEEFNFSIIDGNDSNLFFIGEKSGELFLSKGENLNYESVKSHSLQVKIQNKTNTELYTIITVGVNVLDVNEKPSLNDQSFNIIENSQNNTIIGSVIATDLDAGQTLLYSIVSGNSDGYFSIDSSNGNLILAKPVNMNGQVEISFGLIIRVEDNSSDHLFSEANVTITKKDDLVAYFPFDGNALDQSQLNNVCTVKGCSLTEDRFGIPERAYRFDGIDDMMVISNSYSLNFDAGVDSYTINLWVKATDPTNGNHYSGRLFSKWNDDLKYNYPFSIQFNNANCLAATYQKDNYASVVNYFNIWNGQWRMITFVVDNSTRRIYSYVDGNVVETVSNMATVNTQNAYDIIIGYCWPNSVYYKGLMDDILIYNRALSTNEIKTIFTYK
jgi:hypothetical protein